MFDESILSEPMKVNHMWPNPHFSFVWIEKTNIVGVPPVSLLRLDQLHLTSRLGRKIWSSYNIMTYGCLWEEKLIKTKTQFFCGLYVYCLLCFYCILSHRIPFCSFSTTHMKSLTVLWRLGKLIFFCIIYIFLCEEMKICLGLIFILYDVRVSFSFTAA